MSEGGQLVAVSAVVARMMMRVAHPRTAIRAAWARLIPEEQWHVLSAGRDAACAAGSPMLLGGALALAAYTGRWRNTKDIDLIVPPGRQEGVVAALRAAGFEDYFAQAAYDRSWIFRGWREGVILDVIWSLPNHRVPVDAVWFERARHIRLHGENYEVAPAEELIRVKLYVMQRERCDWVDVFNILAGTADALDWEHLVERMGRDLPLLHAALATFAWLAPARAAAIPPELRARFGIEFPDDGEDLDATERRHVALFDSRPWWAAHQPADQPLER